VSSSDIPTETATVTVTVDDNGLLLPVESFASGYTMRGKNEMIKDEDEDEDRNSNLVSSEEEQALIQFYAGKLPSVIGPNATIPRLRRDVKVLATAALLFRRFFLSNSVLAHDPKCIMVASAFLGSKVEDATVDVSSIIV